MDRRILYCPLLLVALAGCRGAPAPAYPQWTRAESAVPREGGAYRDYVLASQQAETTAAQYLNRTWFTPGKRDMAIQLTGGALRNLESGTRKQCDFEFKPTKPFEPVANQKGWRLLGRVLVWKIEDAVKAGDEEKAIYYAGVATKFGFDLTGGGALDASLGLTIVDEARRAIAPAMPRMQSASLGILGERINNALASKPALDLAINNESENMMMGVQLIQDAYRDRKWDTVEERLGNDIHPAVVFLKDMEHDDAEMRPAYFQNFASEADARTRWLLTAAKTPAAERSKIPEPEQAEERPWKRFAKHFFSTAKPLLEVNDATVARTRLMILEAAILQQVKKNKVAPRNLKGIPAELTTDPYTGKPFVYRADGGDYRIYSVGTDFRDDGGETDETYFSPDLTLELGQ